ncbi:MAG TPA: ATP synthase F0 subunit B [Blastocatellia bacterium]|nr:ATP synthase F0 subunit B [Blastocatellia bacterium]
MSLGILAENALPEHPVWRVINLIVFIALLAYIFRNKLKIGQVFDNRAAKIAMELRQAKQERDDAQARLAEIDARLAGLDQECAQIKADAAIEAGREAERIRLSAAADAEKLEQVARREIEGAMKAARAELKAFVADNSVSVAESIIRRNISTDDNNRMLAEYAGRLGEVSK